MTITGIGETVLDIVPVAHAFSANVVASLFNYVDADFRCEPLL